jgi:acetate kinase
MLILVANLGSTSFKFKLLDSEKSYAQVAAGAYERIGQAGSAYASHGDVIDEIIRTLPQKPGAIGFKAAHGGPIKGAVRVDASVIATMEQFADVAPAHNPPYVAAMRSFAGKLPDVPQVAAFETAFHQSAPEARMIYAIPHEWTEKLGIRRYGFHGSSNTFVSQRLAEIKGKPVARHVNCHLGGSCSVTGIREGKSIGNSFGMTVQSGLPANNRVGDFEIFILPKLLKTGLAVEDILRKLAKEGGLLGMSGVSPDVRDIEAAADNGDDRAKLALDAFVESVRHYIGAYAVALGGVDVLSFTGGIGENATRIRAAICQNLDFLGLKLDPAKNEQRKVEAKISTESSPGEIWIVPTNEELVVARQTFAVLTTGN